MRADRVPELVVTGAVSAWVVATALSQTPDRRFDALRTYDRSTIAIPNWRFFAPSPAQHDNLVAYRVRYDDGTVSGWQDLFLPQERRWNHALFYPRRRREKGLTDLVMIVLDHMMRDLKTVEESVGYRALVGLTRRVIMSASVPGEREPQGFQFLLARDAGYAEDVEPELLFCSRYEPLVVAA